MKNLNIGLNDFKAKELELLCSKSINSLALDFYKGLSIKNLSLKYNLPYIVLKKIYIDNKVELDKYRNLNPLDVIIDYDSGMSIGSIAKNFNIDTALVERIILDNKIDMSLKNKFSKIVKPFKLESNIDLFRMISDLYQSGFSASDLKDKYGVSSGASYYGTLQVSSFDKIKSIKDVMTYQRIVGAAYDSGILTNEHLENLFTMSKADVDMLKSENKNYNDFVNNKLYQIYYMPSLLYGISFTDDIIKNKAYNFINRRYGEEIVKIKDRNRSNLEKVDALIKAKDLCLREEQGSIEKKSYIEERFLLALDKLQCSSAYCEESIRNLSELYYGTKNKNYIIKTKKI